jgi:hypothetical protein
MQHNSAIRKGSLNVIDFAGMKARREAPKPKKPKGSKAKRLAGNANVTERFGMQSRWLPGRAADNISKVGMR